MKYNFYDISQYLLTFVLVNLGYKTKFVWKICEDSEHISDKNN